MEPRTCRFCGQPIQSPRRRSFCGDACVHEYLIRHNRNYAREMVYRRDHGICAFCGIDARHVEALTERAKELGRTLPRGRRTGFDVHHVVPVSEGGEGCSLAGLKTVCIFCHQDITRDHEEQNRLDHYEDYSDCEYEQ
jgi:5-methylcytosine-specific restriction enzyme A